MVSMQETIWPINGSNFGDESRSMSCQRFVFKKNQAAVEVTYRSSGLKCFEKVVIHKAAQLVC